MDIDKGQLLVGIMVATFLFTLVSGRALAPLHGIKPEVVNRREHPLHYWLVVALLAVLMGATLWWQIMKAAADGPS